MDLNRLQLPEQVACGRCAASVQTDGARVLQRLDRDLKRPYWFSLLCGGCAAELGESGECER